MDAKKIYKKLLAYFGPQGWWPIFDKKTKSCKYFIKNEIHTISYERMKKCAFEICVGAILTQNTAWKNVEKALCNLHTNCHPEGVLTTEGSQLQWDSSPRTAQNDNGRRLTPQFILNCKNLEKLIQPAGYYNQKAKKLRIFSAWWLKSVSTKTKRPLSFCGNLKITEMRDALLNLWGIGPETADSMLLYAFNKPIFIIDAYTKRLCKEFGIEFKTYDEYRQFFESQLPKSAKLFNEYHALIVAWGKLHSKNKIEALKIIQ